MALFYPWATKEYLLWQMTIGQIIMYHNMAISIKNGESESGDSLLNKSVDELRKMRDESRKLAETERLEAIKQEKRAKYGDV